MNILLKLFICIGIIFVLWGGWMFVYSLWEYNVFQSSEGIQKSIAAFIEENWNFLKFELLKVGGGVFVILFGLFFPKAFPLKGSRS